MVFFYHPKGATSAFAFALFFVFLTVYFPFNPTHPSPNPNAYKSLFSSLLPHLGSTPQTGACTSPSPSNQSIRVPPPPQNQTEMDYDSSMPEIGADGNQTQFKSVPLQEQTHLDGDTYKTQTSDNASNSNGFPTQHQRERNYNASNSNPIPKQKQRQTKPKFSLFNVTSTQNQLRPGRNITNSNQTQLKEDTLTSTGVQEQPQDEQILELSSKGEETAAVQASSKRKRKNKGTKRRKWAKMVDSLKHCDILDGRWVRDESYPLYAGGSCPLIDEPFDCFLNGRPEQGYEKWRWKPKNCDIPRLNGRMMLERLRGKRLVFVGDSLNRNMWESLVCILRNSVQNKSKVFEASGQREFRSGEGSYSFVFKDYGCSIEFFRSNFLVQEWEVSAPNGGKKETLRLDLMDQNWSSEYKNSDIIVFNTAHWWTHEKTWAGKDYYQEGSHVHPTLDVVEAFRRALNTWGRWVDDNVNPNRTLVFFRGYSSSHFSGGQWNSGGSCDGQSEPIMRDEYLQPYPEMMSVLEEVITELTTPIIYLNITVMTDYRKDAHPSMYQKRNLTEEERRSPERYQDCSHWCLPGVPDLWNEILYAQLLMKQGAKPKRR